MPAILDKFKQAASRADLVGCFDCQGELAGGVKLFMKIAGGKLRADAKRDNSKGQPDATRIEKARVFARETMAKLV